VATMIPEDVPSTASEIEQLAFELLRKGLPPECAVWHHSALELEPAQRVPFLALGDELGIVCITPLEWMPSAPGSSSARFWRSPARPELAPEARARLQATEQAVGQLRRVLVASRLEELVDSAGGLRPTLHRVVLLCQVGSADVNRLRLRTVVDGAIVLARDEVPQLVAILRQHTPLPGRLTGDAFNAVRLIVSPSVEVCRRRREIPGDFHLQARMALDLQQEQIVKSYAHLPPEHQALATSGGARLVRGVAGSGKTLILLHRARFLAGQNPGWRVLVLTYNRPLAAFLGERLAELQDGPCGIEVLNFHAWCRRLLVDCDRWRDNILGDGSRKGLLTRLLAAASITLKGLDLDYLLEELDWIRDQGLTEWQAYAGTARRGRGWPRPSGARCGTCSAPIAPICKSIGSSIGRRCRWRYCRRWIKP
jgi:hypothetical protein